MEKNQIYTAMIDALAAEGEGVARIEGRAVFVPGALPGELWDIRIVKVSSSAVWGRGERRISDSPDRVPPACPSAGKCGGCVLQHMSYAAELRFKRERVNDCLRRIGGLELGVSDILAAPETARARCKAIFNVGTAPDGRPVAGFYRARSHDIVSAPDCELVREEALRACEGVLTWMERLRVPAYDEQKHIEGIRHIFVRSSHEFGNAVVTLMSSRPLSPAERSELAETLRAVCPEMSGLVLGVNRARGNSVLAGEFATLWGDAQLTEELCGLRFELSPRSFFQVNPPQAERLYEKAVDYALGGGRGLVLDLYCGTGTIALCMARGAERVIGVELIADAVENAKANAARNGIENAEFLCADAAEAARELRRRSTRPDAVVVDPPRKGLDASVIECIADMAPERVVYVSCDPATLARDLARFAERGYLAQEALAVDMFPRTHHVETVVLLSRA